ncbi:tetratricopeptide repeat protein [Candidatus Sumerlaeota bacterium]|nr:tetratricopeptide repeat protein [Candidatus Sumerlaeota bacterium]
MGRFSKLETKESPARPGEGEGGVLIPGAEPISYEDVLRVADERFYSGDFRGALRCYSRCLSLDNNRITPWVGQILALLLQGQVREGRVWSQRAMECFPDNPVMVSLTGLSMAMGGMVKRGLATSDFALSRGAEDRICWIARGWILLEAQNKNWEFCFSKVLESRPSEDWRTHMLIGVILESYKKWPHAVERYQAAVGNQTSNFYLWYRLGVCYGKLGLARKAMEAQEHALAINPDFAPAEQETRKQSGLPIAGMLARVRGLFSARRTR